MGLGARRGEEEGRGLVVLDATAGNRTMYQLKDHESIVYLDVERRLEVPPTIFADATNTPFPDATFSAVLFDPPHNWGAQKHYHSYPDKASYRQSKWKDKSIPRYYGWDRYKHRSQLVKFVYKAQQEFYRILKPDGLLFLKWNEMRITIERILSCFADWQELMRLYISDPTHTAGEAQTFWILFAKRPGLTRQSPLLQFQ